MPPKLEGSSLPAPVETPEVNPLLALIPLFPAIGAIINGLLGTRIQRKFGVRAVHGIAITAVVLSAVVAWTVFFQLYGLDPEHRAMSFVAWDWLHVGYVDARFAFWLDPLSSMMLLIITTIGSLIHIYSIGYMNGEKAYWRFFCYLNLFVTMMLLLVLGDNFLLMFIGWEGVGLASYLLIGFWYKELPNAAAGMKAFVVNRFGDACFVIGLFMLFWGLQGSWTHTPEAGDRPELILSYHQSADAEDGERTIGPRPTSELPAAPAASLTFHRLAPIFEAEIERAALRRSLEDGRAKVAENRKAEYDAMVDRKLAGFDAHQKRSAIQDKTLFGIPLVFLIAVLFFLGATAKSAQIPFYVWLPDAMAGPTPVSALIHAATMVTAGVYMIARLNFLFALSPGACTVVGLVGALTALFAASMGLFQYDIKKVLAYSTVSQLGFMFMGVGVGAYWAGVFHLLTHACFKACLFLGSGSVILGCHHEQDMRRMGGLKKYMPHTARTYALACFAIAGFPLAAGFCSKDEILWKAFSSAAVLPYANYLIWGLGVLAATLTAFYMYRSYYMTFTGEYRGNDIPLTDPYPIDTARAEDLLQPKPVPGPSAELLASLSSHDETHAESASHDAHDDAHDHHHGGGTPHESPWQMTFPLWALGVASIILGVIVGFPPVVDHLLHLGFPPLLEHWLEPVLAPGQQMMALYEQGSAMAWLHDESLKFKIEVGLAAFSVLVALTGFGAARFLYKDAANPLPERLLKDPASVLGQPLGGWAQNFHRVVYNKYFVDEGYYLVMVHGMRRVWNALRNIDVYLVDGIVNGAAFVGKYFGFLQGAIDKYLVDGAVNLVGATVARGGQRLQTLQTGHIRTYLVAAFGGALGLLLFLIALGR